MQLREIIKILECKILNSFSNLDLEIAHGSGCDQMSDVLAYVKSDALLLTGLTNTQVIRTADIADVKAVCFVRGKTIDSKIIQLSEEMKIPLLSTKLPMFEACGRLYKAGLKGCEENGIG
ncbi:MAG: hypothetical protein ISS00_03200 [Candidatus Marinimicrobia bacterium]|nr:hypothetical protein [Candidatus Neomarinimicrobiota bacterium]